MANLEIKANLNVLHQKYHHHKMKQEMANTRNWTALGLKPHEKLNEQITYFFVLTE